MASFKRLTEEEASHYFTVEEDHLNLSFSISTDWERVIGFTLTSDPNNPKWDIVTYYSKRKRQTYYNGEGRFYVYILSNPSIPNMLKIGYTGKHPENRAKDISRATGVPTPYKVEWAFKCHDGELMEKEVHKALDYCRVTGNKEHFAISLDEAKEVIENIGKKYT